MENPRLARSNALIVRFTAKKRYPGELFLVRRIRQTQVHPTASYVVNGVAKDVPITESYKGVMPFFISDVFRTLLLLFFPGISLWLVKPRNRSWTCQSAPGRLNRVRSVVAQKVNSFVSTKVSVHAALQAEVSGQLRFLG